MLDGIKGLFESKKAIVGGSLVVCSTVLVAIGKMTVADWETYTQWIFGIWASAETANGVAATIKGHTKPAKVVKEEKKAE